MSEDLRPWEQGENEPDDAYSAFIIYRDIVSEYRSVDAAYRIYEKKVLGSTESLNLDLKKWYEWSNEYAWEKRAKSWDVEIRRRQDIGNLQAAQRNALEAATMAGNLSNLSYGKLEAALQDEELSIPVSVLFKIWAKSTEDQRTALIYASECNLAIEEESGGSSGLEFVDAETGDPV